MANVEAQVPARRTVGPRGWYRLFLAVAVALVLTLLVWAIAQPGSAVVAERPSPFHHVLDTPRWESVGFVRPVDLAKIGPFHLTKFMVLEVVAALLVAVIYIPLARRLHSGRPARGALQNPLAS